ncbi:hypothetical protein NPIL_489661 [Nephila pilipes]|uniref:Uncharacterized protein n=1 Tax=Nephila pilipes TaxID=299642 RepID=A0A8X6TDC1_NEPPI|nr:hypothetical protein NPIL_489661 [Nephila pilipes]
MSASLYNSAYGRRRSHQKDALVEAPGRTQKTVSKLQKQFRLCLLKRRILRDSRFLFGGRQHQLLEQVISLI